MKNLTLTTFLILLSFTFFGQPYVTTWQSDLVLNPYVPVDNTITILTDSLLTYDYTVDWGDGTQDTNITGNFTHAYSSAGTYTISITGVFPRLVVPSIDGNKLLSVDQWGGNQWTSMAEMFRSCPNLNILATDTPDLSACTSMDYMFQHCSNLDFDPGNWDVSNIETFLGTFFGCTLFDADLSSWQTSNATVMAAMFTNAENFNQDLNNWDVSNVEYTLLMFAGCSSLNQSFEGWDISSVQDMSDMFWDTAISIPNYDQTLLAWGDPSNTVQPNVHLDFPANYCLGDVARQNLINNFGWTINDYGQDCSVSGCIEETACNYDITAALDDGSCEFTIDACGVCGGTATVAGCTDSAACNFDPAADCDDASCDYSCGFISTWQTNANNESITIPTNGGGYDYSVDWGDGTITTGNTGDATHIYANSGQHTIKITGDFPRIYFFLEPDAFKIHEINQWGTIQWHTLSNAFATCNNLDVLATDAPDLSMVTEIDYAFFQTNIQSPDLSNWNVSNVTDMTYMFSFCSNFTGNISSWDVSSLENAFGMFTEAIFFNGDLSAWDMSSAINLRYMFKGCSNFNADISSWNVSSVTDMNNMFNGASSFNQDLNNWNVSSVTDMNNMFNGASSFNQDLNNWDVSSVTDMNNMFNGASSFNQDLNNWNVSSVEGMFSMFLGASSFQGAIYNWDINSLTLGNNFFLNSGIIQENYDLILTHWSQLPAVPNGISLGQVPSFYCQGASGRDVLINTHGWSIIDFGNNCPGCTDPAACNYDSEAVIDDGSCTFVTDACGICGGTGTIAGCTDPAACNYDSSADCDDASCLFTDACGVCGGTGTSAGCTDPVACNFDPTADCDDASCLFIDACGVCGGTATVAGCTDPAACNYDSSADCDDASCLFTDACGVCGGTGTSAGCTDPVACNFDPTADCDDASCDYSCGFISTWQTNANNESITIPTDGGGYDYSVDWGDGTITTGNTGDATHIYANSGQHTIKITGDFPRIYFFLEPDAFKIHEINQWGTIQWHTLSNAFATCNNLDVLATDAPDLSMVTEIDYAFFQTNIQSPDLSNWNVSNVTDMTYMFGFCSNFTGNISSWDVSSLENAFGMFTEAIFFNGDLSAWDMSSAINLRYMFKGCSNFNADISSWNVSSVTDMNNMFNGASSFNQDLNNWDVSSVTDMNNMFNGASSFNQDLNNWNVSSVEGMFSMFLGASSFQGAIYNWDINSLTLGNNVFLNSGIIQENYDLILTHWSQLPAVPNGISLGQVPSFYCQGASGRDVLINTHGWSIIDFGNNCPGCTDPAACNYDSEAAVDDGSCTFVTDACGICGGTGTIAGCTDPAACNYDSSADCDDASCDYGCGFITTWQTTNDNESITIPTFGGGYAYSVDWGDGTITTGHTGNATHTYATSGTHTIKLAGDFPRIFFFLASSASKIYEINQWGNIEWQSFTLAFFNCSNLDVLATDAPDLSMVSKMNDAFTGTNIQSPDLSNWDVSSVTEMLKMFSNCTNFNGNISSWDVSSVEDAAYMFDGATNFNGDISAWDMSSAIKLRSMFNNATSFNADISGWDVSSVNDMNFMFKGATSFNQDLNNWDVTAVEDILGMFWGASSFQGAIYNWNISSLAFASNFLRDSGIIQENYDLILINWSQLPAVPNGINLDQVPSFYCPGASARAELINTHGWSVIDFGINCPGCTDPTACNYDSGAVIDDGSCLFIVDACGNCGGTSTAPGCTDEDALNYCGYADCDDGSCIYGEDICGECTIWDDVSGQCIADPNCQDSGTCLGDFNEDNLINAADLLTFLGVFGTTCAE